MDEQLTDEQRDAMIRFGDPESVVEAISTDVLHQLLALGLLHERPSDGNLDFTVLGESVYDELVKE